MNGYQNGEESAVALISTRGGSGLFNLIGTTTQLQSIMDHTAVFAESLSWVQVLFGARITDYGAAGGLPGSSTEPEG